MLKEGNREVDSKFDIEGDEEAACSLLPVDPLEVWAELEGLEVSLSLAKRLFPWSAAEL